MEDRYREELNKLQFSDEAKARMVAAVEAAALEDQRLESVVDASSDPIPFKKKHRTSHRSKQILYPAAAILAVLICGYAGLSVSGQIPALLHDEESAVVGSSQVDLSAAPKGAANSGQLDSAASDDSTIAIQNAFNITLPCLEDMEWVEWNVQFDNEGIIEYNGSYQEENELGYGGKKNATFRFAPVAPGTVTISFYPDSAGNGAVYDVGGPIYTYTFTVDDELQATLVDSSCVWDAPFVSLDPEYLE